MWSFLRRIFDKENYYKEVMEFIDRTPQRSIHFSYSHINGLKDRAKTMSLEEIYRELLPDTYEGENVFEQYTEGMKDYMIDGYIVVDISDENWRYRAMALRHTDIDFVFSVDIYKPDDVRIVSQDFRVTPGKENLKKLAKRSYYRYVEIRLIERYLKGEFDSMLEDMGKDIL